MKSLSRFIAGAALAAATSIAFAVDIVDTAVSAGQFKTLVKAVQEAGLVDTLKGEGPFTVFAPTDEAFAKLPAGTLDALLQDKEKLATVLTYHVVPGKVTAAQVRPGMVKTVQGQSLTVKANRGGVMVDNAKVVKTDIIASNGVIHVIDTVVLPKSVAEVVSAPARPCAGRVPRTTGNSGDFLILLNIAVRPRCRLAPRR
jgi:uncharacterized surface protein with fasciclin (FAS1) repeats